MDYRFSDEDTALRERIRKLIADYLPANYPGIFVEEDWPLEASASFSNRLGEEELLTLSWPKEYGGQEASLWAQTVVREEMWGHNEPRGSQYMGLNWIGPAIMTFGTAAQKEKHLKAIAAGKGLWCQGFSEPDAGSDLAALRLSATKCEEGWLINGQKIWTSYSDIANWCFLTARTNSDGPKQHGITVFLIPMDRPGIEVRPITSMLGPHHFFEVFFTDLYAYPDDVLGSVDRGWDIITAGLTYERTGVARYSRSLRMLAQLRKALGERWDDLPAALKARYAVARVHLLAAQLLSYRIVSESELGKVPRLQASVGRIAGTVVDQEVADIVMEALGPLGMLDHTEDGAPAGGIMEHHWRYHQAGTIAAGTLETQKNIVARLTL